MTTTKPKWIRTSHSKKQAPSHFMPIIFKHGGYLCQFYFINFNNRWQWIFETGDNRQTHLDEDDVTAFLGLSGRTVANWRTGKQQPDKNALLLLYVTFSGYTMPAGMARSGYRFSEGSLLHSSEIIAPQPKKKKTAPAGAEIVTECMTWS